MQSSFSFSGNDNTKMKKQKIALASSSPRRLELLRALDLNIRVVSCPFKESINPDWAIEEIAQQLAIQKRKQAETQKAFDESLITADTVVLHEGEILHKPKGRREAREYLRRLSNSEHDVITGVSIAGRRTVDFSVTTKVWLENIPSSAIEYYIDRYQPFDKAGAYGIQEWIGWAYISRIEGSYSNVMGLPTCEVYHALSLNESKE